ncbi:hypothetical protein NFC80_11875 [Bacillus halotolerans]|nr:hypothetical protein [Bacillus halotolerans]MCR6597329.1 hypothetical protein [Bacillus halotolerans]
MKNRSPSPSEGFTESLRVNSAFVRFRVKSLQFKQIDLTESNRSLTW